MDFLAIPLQILERLDLGWTFVLFLARYTALLMLLPGIGMGAAGLVVRMPCIIVLSFVSCASAPSAALPADGGVAIAQIVSELLWGSILGLIPALIVASVQTGMQLASTTMGLSASNLIDPHSGVSVSDLSRIYAEVVIAMFLLIDGHHVILYAASGVDAATAPGSFVLTELTMKVLIERSAEVLSLGMTISAPIVVALLLTQFVMGLISRAVSTVNIFIISYPLTIGIGFVIAILAFPDTMRVVLREFKEIEDVVMAIDAQADSDEGVNANVVSQQ
jgi:flagellar biosynthesis protein FliR